MYLLTITNRFHPYNGLSEKFLFMEITNRKLLNDSYLNHQRNIIIT